MRWMLLLILILLAIYYFMPEPEPVPVEKTFIGGPVKALNKAKGFESEYLKATKEHQKKIDEAVEKEAGNDGD